MENVMHEIIKWTEAVTKQKKWLEWAIWNNMQMIF